MPVSDKKRKDGKRYGMGAAKPFELELPSLNEDGEHNVCLVRRPGPQGLVKLGLLDSLDTLTGLVAANIQGIEDAGKTGTRSGQPSPEAMKALAENAEKVRYALDVIDKVVVGVVVEPKVSPIPTEEKPDSDRPEGESWEWRDPDKLYIDDVDLEDKQHILNFAVGGTSDWKSFREQSAANVADMEAISVVPDDSE